MKLSRFKKADAVRRYLLELIRNGRANPVSIAQPVLDLSRQSINNHLRWLVANGYLIAEGDKRGRKYKLGSKREQSATYNLSSIQEHVVYSQDFSFVFNDLPDEISSICHYGFTEMLNNAIDHSDGTKVYIYAVRDAENVTIWISDNGEGIFKRIARLLQLADPRESILELSKGKLTTDPENHTGEGIFFTSRVFDYFEIESGDLSFTHTCNKNSDVLLHIDSDYAGTHVIMKTSVDSTLTMKNIFDEYAGPDEYRFEKTIVPVRLVLYEGEQLVSRSQAKRLMNRVERFSIVVLDFEDVELVGQGFADEVFRVFQTSHPKIELVPINMTEDVEKMIRRVSPPTAM